MAARAQEWWCRRPIAAHVRTKRDAASCIACARAQACGTGAIRHTPRTCARNGRGPASMTGARAQGQRRSRSPVPRAPCATLWMARCRLAPIGVGAARMRTTQPETTTSRSYAAVERIVLRSGVRRGHRARGRDRGRPEPQHGAPLLPQPVAPAGLRVRRGRGPLRRRAAPAPAPWPDRGAAVSGWRRRSTSWPSHLPDPRARRSSGSDSSTPTSRGLGTTGTWRSPSPASTNGCCDLCLRVCLRVWVCHRCRPAGRPASCAPSSPASPRRSSPWPIRPRVERDLGLPGPADRPRGAHGPHRAPRRHAGASRELARPEQARSTAQVNDR